MTSADDVAIRIRELGKYYRLGVDHNYKTVRDNIARFASAPFARRAPPADKPGIWAIKDLSLDVGRGEVLGIIGRNGSGKSTLLKLLTRITHPNTGRIEINGRIGALLEVGTGFHPELTGRENVYMNGLILGMSRSEVARKFDEIVEFSGVEQFIDTPVKRYSSGMRLRLGFSVAAHLDPEILVVDEVLAVGDAEFQRKCIGRMNGVAQEGRTVLFVSHQMEAILGLCTRAVWLQKGGIVASGETASVVSRYLEAGHVANNAESIADRVDRSGDGKVRVVKIDVHDGQGHSPQTGGRMVVDVELAGQAEVSASAFVSVRLGVFDHTERVVTMLSNDVTGEQLQAVNGRSQFLCLVSKLPLVPGGYSLNVAVRLHGALQDKLFSACNFEVMPGQFYPGMRDAHAGIFHVEQSWSPVKCLQ